MIDVREGGHADLDVVAAIHVRSRQHTYRGILPQEKLDAIDPAEHVRTWRENYTDETRIYLAYEGETPVGFCFVGQGWLWAIHVDHRWHGAGAGPALMRAGRDGLRELGFHQASLWVIEENARARRFYEREGWVRSGAVREKELSGAMTRQLEYVCDL
jgi:ribosomal protein S18 acetylase RimI-like enzyme